MSDEERDAFGRRMGASESSPAAVARSPTPDPVPRSVPGGPRSPGLPGRALTLVFVVLALAGLGLVLWKSDRAALDSPAVIGRDLGDHGLGSASLLRAEHLGPALAAVRADRHGDEQLVGLRLTPQELSTRIRDGHGNLRLVDVDLAGKVHSTDWSTDTTSTPIDLATIDPAVPQRIVASALRRSGADDTHLDSLSLTASSGPPSWSIQLDDVKIGDQSWTADLAGVAVTRPGELPAASGLTGRSLLGPVGLRGALTQIARRGSRLTSLRIQPDRLDATVRSGGGLLDITVDAAQRLGARETPGSATDALAIARIDPAAPRRGLSKVLARTGLPASRIAYVTVQDIPTAIDRTAWTWLIVLDDRVSQSRRIWRASLDGRTVMAP